MREALTVTCKGCTCNHLAMIKQGYSFFGGDDSALWTVALFCHYSNALSLTLSLLEATQQRSCSRQQQQHRQETCREAVHIVYEITHVNT